MLVVVVDVIDVVRMDVVIEFSLVFVSDVIVDVREVVVVEVSAVVDVAGGIVVVPV